MRTSRAISEPGRGRSLAARVLVADLSPWSDEELRQLQLVSGRLLRGPDEPRLRQTSQSAGAPGSCPLPACQSRAVIRLGRELPLASLSASHAPRTAACKASRRADSREGWTPLCRTGSEPAASSSINLTTGVGSVCGRTLSTTAAHHRKVYFAGCRLLTLGFNVWTESVAQVGLANRLGGLTSIRR